MGTRTSDRAGRIAEIAAALDGTSWVAPRDWQMLGEAVALARESGPCGEASLAEAVELWRSAMCRAAGRLPTPAEARAAIDSGRAAATCERFIGALGGAPARGQKGMDMGDYVKAATVVRVKDPTSPATDRQLDLLDALVERGIVASGEVAGLGENPLKGAVAALIDSHSGEPEFAALMEERRASRAPRRKEAGREAPALASVSFPASHVRLVHGSKGDFARFRIPDGVVVGGRDVGGHTFSRKVTDRMLAQLGAGAAVTATFSTERPLRVYDPAKRASSTLLPGERGENIWALCKSVKEARGGEAPSEAGDAAWVDELEQAADAVSAARGPKVSAPARTWARAS